MPTAGLGQLAGPLDTLAEMFGDSATFAADAIAAGAATGDERVYSISDEDDAELPYVILYEPKSVKWDRTLGAFGAVELEGRLAYAIDAADSEREAYVKFANKITAIGDELEALADGGGGTLVNFQIEFEEPALRTDPLREGGTQEYSSMFRVRCGLEG